MPRYRVAEDAQWYGAKPGSVVSAMPEEASRWVPSVLIPLEEDGDGSPAGPGTKDRKMPEGKTQTRKVKTA